MSNVLQWACVHAHPDNQGITTNNYTESYHRKLKQDYLPRNCRARPDDLVHILVIEFEPDLKSSEFGVKFGFADQATNKTQALARERAEAYTLEHLEILGIRIQKANACYLVDSLTNPLIQTYSLRYVPAGRHTKAKVSNCNCLAFARGKLACKHMYLIARLYKMCVVEDAKTMILGDWLSGPLGNVPGFIDSAAAQAGKHPSHLLQLVGSLH